MSDLDDDDLDGFVNTMMDASMDADSEEEEEEEEKEDQQNQSLASLGLEKLRIDILCLPESLLVLETNNTTID